jgi:hypothetical protein
MFEGIFQSPETDIIVRSLAQDVASTALLVTAGILILAGARDVFEVDQRLKRIRDPIGRAAGWMWEWRLMSDAAEDARGSLVHIAGVLRVVVRGMLFFTVLLFGGTGIAKLLEFVSGNLENSCTYVGLPWPAICENMANTAGVASRLWEANSEVQFIVRNGYKLLFLGFAPFLTAWLGHMVYQVVKARKEHTQYKDPWWNGSNAGTEDT